MSTREKRLVTWKYQTPKFEPIDTVEAVLKHYWGKWSNVGSHMMIHDERLNNHPEFHGVLNIPIKGGKQVRGYYLRDIVDALEFRGDIDI